MRISGSGLAFNGMNAIKNVRELHMARAAISAFHDALLAVAKGMVTPEEIKEFFWHNDLAEARFYGGVITFTEEKKDDPARHQKIHD